MHRCPLFLLSNAHKENHRSVDFLSLTPSLIWYLKCITRIGMTQAMKKVFDNRERQTDRKRTKIGNENAKRC
ncbi:hypothetical protein Sjap_022231 [Stephania japonica]|uniref:Uncharacterized protein n=1 Tax=Stephania japonica TaxID=461633 RepID=A0AAP0HSM2_9MAGN